MVWKEMRDLMSYTQDQIDGQADEYARLYERGDVVMACQARETLAAMIGVKRSDALCSEIRKRIALDKLLTWG
jgi:hypothetical protein